MCHGLINCTPIVRHPIEDGNAGIVVRLGQPSIINHIKMLLWDRDMRYALKF